MPEPGEQSFLGRFFDRSKKKQEVAPVGTELVVINESSPLQPYVKNGELERFWDFSGLSGMGVVPASDECYSHNDNRQRFVGETLAGLFSFQDRGSELLEVGYGTNHFVAEGISNTAKLPVCLLDFNNGMGESSSQQGEFNPPRSIEPLSRELPRYVGDMTDIDVPGSALRDRLFAGILYNGSWVAGGNNWTVMQLMEGKYAQALGAQPNWDSPDYAKFKDRALNQSITHAKLWLNGYVLKTRFSTLTDCKGKFRRLNGKKRVELTQKPGLDLPDLF